MCDRKKSEIEVGSKQSKGNNYNTYAQAQHIQSCLSSTMFKVAGVGGGTVVCSLRTDRTVSSKYVDKKKKKIKIQSYYDNIKTLSMTTEIML